MLAFSKLRDHRDNSVLSPVNDYDHDNDNDKVPDELSTPKNLIARRSEAPLTPETPERLPAQLLLADCDEILYYCSVRKNSPRSWFPIYIRILRRH